MANAVRHQLTLKDGATRSPVRLHEVVVRCKHTVDVILRQHHPYVVARELRCQHSGSALEAVVGKLAMACRKPTAVKDQRGSKMRPGEVASTYILQQKSVAKQTRVDRAATGE